MIYFAVLSTLLIICFALQYHLRVGISLSFGLQYYLRVLCSIILCSAVLSTYYLYLGIISILQYYLRVGVRPPLPRLPAMAHPFLCSIIYVLLQYLIYVSLQYYLRVSLRPALPRLPAVAHPRRQQRAQPPQREVGGAIVSGGHGDVWELLPHDGVLSDKVLLQPAAPLHPLDTG